MLGLIRWCVNSDDKIIFKLFSDLNQNRRSTISSKRVEAMDEDFLIVDSNLSFVCDDSNDFWSIWIFIDRK